MGANRAITDAEIMQMRIRLVTPNPGQNYTSSRLNILKCSADELSLGSE